MPRDLILQLNILMGLPAVVVPALLVSLVMVFMILLTGAAQER